MSPKAPGCAAAILTALAGLAAAGAAVAGPLIPAPPAAPIPLSALGAARGPGGTVADRPLPVDLASAAQRTSATGGVSAADQAAGAETRAAWSAAEADIAAVATSPAEPAAASAANVAEPAPPPKPGALAAVGSDARAAGRAFSLFVRREVWPRRAGQFLYLGGLAGVSALLESDKETLRRDVLRSSFYRHSHWTQIGGTLGLTRVGYGAAAAVYLGGLAAGDLEVRRTGLLMAESLLLSQGVAGAVTYAVSEQRPRAGGAIRYFHTGGSSVSIHVTNTMALARVLDHRLARFDPSDGRGRRLAKVLGKVAIYSVPAITGWQRLRSDQHYLWNVVLGAGLSAWVTDALLRAYDRVTAPGTR